MTTNPSDGFGTAAVVDPATAAPSTSATDVIAIENLKLNKVELDDLGAMLPIGVFLKHEDAPVERLQDFVVRPYKTKYDRILGQLLQSPKVKLPSVLGQFLPVMIESIGGYSVEELAKHQSTNPQRMFENMYLADALTMVLQIRLASQGPEISMSGQCPQCGAENKDDPAKGRPYHNIGSVEVTCVEGLKTKPTVEVTLTDGLPDFGDVLKKVHMAPLKLHQIEKISQPASGTPIDISLLYSMITALPESETFRNVRGQIFSDDLYDELTMKDLSILRKAVDTLQPGPDMNTEMLCFSCGHEWKATLPWSALRGFLFVSPSTST